MLKKISIKPILQRHYDLDSIKKHIEYCGRVCYNSRHLITEHSYESFYDMLVKNKHLSVLEHGTIILYGKNTSEFLKHAIAYNKITENDVCIITNMRYFVEYYEKLPYIFIEYNIAKFPESIVNNSIYIITNPSKQMIDNIISERIDNYAMRYTLELDIPIAMSREFNRHRVFSISEQSTRYVEQKNDLDIYKPLWFSKDLPDFTGRTLEYIISYLHTCEFKKEFMYISHALSSFYTYEIVRKNGMSKEYARDLLPLATMTKVIYTTDANGWKDCLSKRSVTGAHPEAKYIVNEIKKLFESIRIENSYDNL